MSSASHISPPDDDAETVRFLMRQLRPLIFSFILYVISCQTMVGRAVRRTYPLWAASERRISTRLPTKTRFIRDT